MQKVLIPPYLYPNTKANLQFGWLSILLDSDSFGHTELEYDDKTVVLTIHKDEILDYKFFDEKK